MKILLTVVLFYGISGFAQETPVDDGRDEMTLVGKSPGKPVKLDAEKSRKKCSPENLDILLHKSATVIGDSGAETAQVVKLFTDPDYSKSNLETLKKRYFEIQKEHTKKIAKTAEEIQALVKDHPECDKDHLFTLKK